ncbi:MAG: hypothetical protein ABIG63_06535 [Chloroflexota bacterium]
MGIGKLVNWGLVIGSQLTNLPIYQSTNLPTYQSTNLPIYQSTNLPLPNSQKPCSLPSAPACC